MGRSSMSWLGAPDFFSADIKRMLKPMSLSTIRYLPPVNWHVQFLAYHRTIPIAALDTGPLRYFSATAHLGSR